MDLAETAEQGFPDEQHAGWAEWEEYAAELDEAQAEMDALNALLGQAVQDERYADAATHSARISAIRQNDPVAAAITERAAAVREERYTDAAAARDSASLWLEGWWVGRGAQADGWDPRGHIVRIEADAVGRLRAHLVSARALAAQASEISTAASASRVAGQGGADAEHVESDGVMWEVLVRDGGETMGCAVAPAEVDEPDSWGVRASSGELRTMRVQDGMLTFTNADDDSSPITQMIGAGDVMDEILKSYMEDESYIGSDDEEDSNSNASTTPAPQGTDTDGDNAAYNTRERTMPHASHDDPDASDPRVGSADKAAAPKEDADGEVPVRLALQQFQESMEGASSSAAAEAAAEPRDRDHKHDHAGDIRAHIGADDTDTLHGGAAVRLAAPLDVQTGEKFVLHVPKQHSPADSELEAMWKANTHGDRASAATELPRLHVPSGASCKPFPVLSGSVSYTRLESHAAEAHMRTLTSVGTDPLSGLFVGDFGPHGAELLRLERRQDRSTGTEEVVATKVTGDPNVPSGALSFRATISAAASSSHAAAATERYVDAGLPVSRVYPGKGHIADPGYASDAWVPGELVQFAPGSKVLNGATLGFVWDIPGARRALVMLQRVSLLQP